MSELYGEKSPQEQEDIERAMGLIDPAGHKRARFSYFLRRLEEVRTMDDEEVPHDTSDAWIFKDSRFVNATRRMYERFEEATEAVANLTAAEREVFELRESIGHEVSRMLIARNQIASADTLTSADFSVETSTE